jgi:hypothetical protein
MCTVYDCVCVCVCGVEARERAKGFSTTVILKPFGIIL